MSDPTFMARLAQAIQVQHEAGIQLQQLASELVDHAMRMRSWTDKLQAHLVAPETPTGRARQEIAPPDGQPIASFGHLDLAQMPRILSGGPQKRGEG